MPIFNNILAGSSGQATGYEIEQSLRFNNPDTPYLSFTPSSTATSTKICTISCWVKRGQVDQERRIFTAGEAGSTPRTEFTFNSTGYLSIGLNPTGSAWYSANTSMLLRDPSAWYHIVWALDTSQATASNRSALYVNGEQVTDFSSNTLNDSTAVPQDSTILMGQSGMLQVVGAYANILGQSAYDGYMAEFHFIDGQKLTPASFGETNSATNQWVPIEVTGMTYGTNGFYQKFSSTELANSFTDSSKDLPSVTYPLSCDFLVIGGGGGGGSGDRSGGGGAGGYRTSAGTSGGGASAESAISLSVGKSYTVTVGAGGAPNNSGVDSSIAGSGITTITSTGGGRGANTNSAAATVGGSGGGGGIGSTNAGASGTTSQGFAGGTGGTNTSNNESGGGGGGASAVGGNGGNDSDAGDGGAGVSSSITGSAVTRAGGGGGGAWAFNGGAAGSGGGGAGGKQGLAGASGTANTGGGGGGGGQGGAGTGGSGTVIIRYASTTQIGTGGTVTSYTDSGTTYQVHTFTSSGTLSFGHTITANGTVVNTRAVTKVNSSSMYIPAGTSNNVTLPAIDFGSDDFTIEMWARDLDTSEMGYFWNNYNGSSHGLYIANIAPNLQAYFVFGGSAQSITGTWNGNDWSHIAVVRNGSTVTLYADGSSLGTATVSGTMGSSGAITMGGTAATADGEGYFDEIRVSDTARYTGTYTPPTTAFTADSNTLLLIQPDWDGGLGADSSGNENDFSVTNLVATDQVLDSPTRNYCTWNPIDIFAANLAGVVSEGNLKIVDSVNHIAYRGTYGLSSGKWYWEIYMITIGAAANCRTGICKTNTYGTSSGTGPIDMGVAYTYDADGQKTVPGSTGAYGATYAAGDIVGVALDMDAGTLTFYKNGATQGQMASGITDEVAPLVCEGNGSYQFDSIANFGQDSSFAGNKTAQGNGGDNEDFYYTPPTGYKALNTDNLDDAAIALPEDYFNPVLYTGNSTGGRDITVGMAPDLVWCKNLTGNNHSLTDSVRGVNRQLSSNLTANETTHTNRVTAFNSDGFTTGDSDDTNANNDGIISWNWKAGGAPTVDNSAGAGATPTAGSVKIDGANLGSALAGTIPAVRLSANTTSGFSIIIHDGTGSNGTLAHGLSQAPSLVIAKPKTNSVDAWRVGSDYLASWVKELRLNDTSAQTDRAAVFNSLAPTSSVVNLGTDGANNGGGATFVTYCFHSVEGYSKVGSYSGNGSTDGTFIYTGMAPAFIMAKRTDSADNWAMYDSARDTYNVRAKYLLADSNQAEATYSTAVVDFLSNGFKWRGAVNFGNNSSGSYIYLAFAESPFKTSNAR